MTVKVLGGNLVIEEGSTNVLFQTGEDYHFQDKRNRDVFYAFSPRNEYIEVFRLTTHSLEGGVIPYQDFNKQCVPSKEKLKSLFKDMHKDVMSGKCFRSSITAREFEEKMAIIENHIRYTEQLFSKEQLIDNVIELRKEVNKLLERFDILMFNEKIKRNKGII